MDIASYRKRLGRLTALGLEEPWQAALLLPNGWDDFRNVVSDYRLVGSSGLREGDRVVIVGALKNEPIARFDGTAPRLVGNLQDASGRRIGWTVFGDTRALAERLRQVSTGEVVVAGRLTHFHGWWLRECEFISPEWAGRLRPRYIGKARVIGPATVRERVLALLPTAVPIAAEWLIDSLCEHGDERTLLEIVGAPTEALTDLIWKAHLPNSEEEGVTAQGAMERMAALGAVDRARQHVSIAHRARWRTPVDWSPRARQLPFTLTTDQTKATIEIVNDLAGERAMHRVLAGDVGTGKTVVYGLAACSCVDGGGRVAVLLPNQALADQVARECATWWPDLHAVLVTGGRVDTAMTEARFIIGTTALLHRHTGEFDLLIVDEQHKFSRAQRDQLRTRGAHLLEVSATCIPRSQALIEYGVVAVSRLRNSAVQKQLRTRLWRLEERPGLFAEVQATVATGHQVLVVYPRRDGDAEHACEAADEARCSLPSVEEAFAPWERHFPGQVRLAHGGMSDEAIADAINSLRVGQASILVATTVVEVGINLPALRRVVIIHPERYGITTLHQLRGRVARSGGVGYCDLYLAGAVSDKSLQRLSVLLETTDGFEIAVNDLTLRGFGDLAPGSDRQHGADQSFLFGRPVRPKIVEQILASTNHSS